MSKIIATPFVIGLFICLYLAWEYDSAYAFYIIPQAVVLVVLYVMAPQIDWWWYNRHPKELDEKIRQLLERHFPFYMELNPEQKKRFRQRMMLYPMAKEFMPRGFETLPEDIKAMIAANNITITFGQKDYLLNQFETIVVYPKPFPTPQFPRQFHSTEHFIEDGVLLFSAEQLMLGSLHVKQYFNICMYEMARIYPLHFPETQFPELPETIWTDLEEISGFSKMVIEQTVGLPEVDPQAVSVCHFFIFPKKFLVTLPELYNTFQAIFNLDPAKMSQPVLDLELLELAVK